MLPNLRSRLRAVFPQGVRSLRRIQPVIAMASALWSRLSIFLVLFLAAKLLPPDEFGVFSVIQIVYGIVVALVCGGDMWLNRFTRNTSGAAFLTLAQGNYLLLSFATAVILLGLGLPGAFLWSDIDIHGHLGTAVAGLIAGILGGITEVCFAVVRSYRRVFFFFLLRDFTIPASILALLVLVRPATAAAVFVIFGAVSLAAVMLMLAAGDFVSAMRRALKNLRTRRGRHLGLLAIRHTASAQSGNILARLTFIDVFVLSSIIPVEQVGEYRLDGQLALGFVVIQHFLFLSLPWQLRAAGRSRGRGVGAEQVAKNQRLLLMLAGLAFIVLLVAAKPILLIFGARFTDNIWIFRAMLGLRFAGLLWGPQHEVLVSGGRMLGDALTNLTVIPVWAIAFLLTWQFETPLQAAVIATAIADAAVQGMRAVTLRRAGLHVSRGHPFGPVLPCALTIAIVLSVL